jgi:N-acetyl-anhydromuramyl-L-alanine amidase AmpD
MNLSIDKTTGLLNCNQFQGLGLKDGGRPMPVRRCVVIHYTEGGSAMSSIDWWRQPQNRKNDLGAHFVIDRDGTIYQVRSCNRTMSHAGVSRWRDPKTGILHRNLNSCSIGIELANAGSEVQRIKVATLPGYAGTTAMRHRNESTQKV